MFFLLKTNGGPRSTVFFAADLVLAELAGGEGLACLARQVPGRDVHRCVRGEVAEVSRVPELEGLNRPD